MILFASAKAFGTALAFLVGLLCTVVLYVRHSREQKKQDDRDDAGPWGDC